MRAPPPVHLFCLCLLWVGFAQPGHAQTNIVRNGSFEEIEAYWTTGNLSIYPNQGAPDGIIHIGLISAIYQDLETVPGRTYVLSVALGGSPHAPFPVTSYPVMWGSTTVGSLTNFTTVGAFWQYFYCYVQAESNVTRLRFDPGGLIDDVRVGWVEEPIQVTEQPESRTAFEGGTVSFSVRADGAPPLRYQWLFNGQPISEATNRTLTISQLHSSQVGQYSVRMSNSWSAAQSQPAELQLVPPATAPAIVAQPVGDICPAGYGCNLSVFAVGAPPLSYQWRRDGADLGGATNASLIFDAIQTENAGAYTVLVSNHLGTVLSLPAPIIVTNTTGGRGFFLDSRTNNAPIFDVDGTTRIGGPQFAVQIYAGPLPDILRPVGPSFNLGSDIFSAGYFQVFRTIPDVAANQIFHVQVRAWETAWGATYEAARAGGGKFGFSAVFQSSSSPFQPPIRLRSFSLRAGEPFFITGRLGIGPPLPDGTPQYTLTGETGARYLIEVQQPPNNWLPLLTLTNTTGTTLFSDPTSSTNLVQLYRARLLD